MITEKRLEIIRRHTFRSESIRIENSNYYFYDRAGNEQNSFYDRYPYFSVPKDLTNKLRSRKKFLNSGSDGIDLPEDFARALYLAHMFEDTQYAD